MIGESNEIARIQQQNVFGFSAAMNLLNLTLSLADQRFDQTKSLGIFNFSLGLSRVLARNPEVKRLTLLTNASLPLVGQVDSGRVALQECAHNNVGKLWRLWWDQFGVYQAARRTGNPWLLLPKGYASFLMRPPVKLAVYIHDVIPEFFRKFYPKEFPVQNVYFLRSLRAAIEHASVIFVNSQFTASQIHGFANNYGLRVPQIEVVGVGFDRPLGIETSRRTSILTLANRMQYKRTDLALAHFSRWQKERRFDGQIDWVGGLPRGLTFPSFSSWRLHSRLGPNEFVRMFLNAQAMVYFSEYEGFGMPPVEAAMAGACPVYSDLPVTREVMQDMGYRFANDNYESFALALDRSLKTPTLEINTWAERLLARYNWESVASRVVKAFYSLDRT